MNVGALVERSDGIGNLDRSLLQLGWPSILSYEIFINLFSCIENVSWEYVYLFKSNKVTRPIYVTGSCTWLEGTQGGCHLQ